MLDLATRLVSHPADSRPLDDQPVWHGNSTLLYPLRTPNGEEPAARLAALLGAQALE